MKKSIRPWSKFGKAAADFIAFALVLAIAYAVYFAIGPLLAELIKWSVGK